MKKSTAAWGLSGLLAGFLGLAVGFLLAQWMNLRLDPVSAVAELVRDGLPADVVNWGRENDGKTLTVPGILVVLGVVFVGLGLLARRRWWAPVVGYAVLGVVGGVALLRPTGSGISALVPLVAAFAAMTLASALLGERLRRLQALDVEQRYGVLWRGRRRDFLIIASAVVGVGGLSVFLGRLAGRDVRAVEEERQTKVRTVTAPEVPAGARLDVEGAAPWMTPVADFYLIDTAFVKPVVRAKGWSLRIHGLVDRELELTYEELVERGIHESWVTLTCVSNEVGGDLIGNAWFSGVLLAPLLAEAGPQAGADAVLQTSADGWTCGTPLDALTDGRQAMLAVAMNGETLTIEHGYPVRTVVPGLYGYVSACKWVVDLEVTRFDEVDAYWTQRGWGERGPVKIASRIEVPADGAAVGAGEVVVAGSAWSQHTGIRSVEIQVDGGPWTPAQLGAVPSTDTWVQWRASVGVDAGDHTVLVRATGTDGEVQTGAVADVLPDGATGWHGIGFSADEG